MPKFEYTNNATRAAVSFPAHKFPHTSSVYYQCNVRLCINNGGCEQMECNATSPDRLGGPRRKRFVAGQANRLDDNKLAQAGELAAAPSLPAPSALKSPAAAGAGDMSFDVYSGLYVSDLELGGKYLDSILSLRSFNEL